LYTLSDGTVVTYAVGHPKGYKTGLTRDDWEEVRHLREVGEVEDLPVEEKEVRGRLFVFQRQLFILSDGSEVIIARGEPAD
jgi:hypothetical protein